MFTENKEILAESMSVLLIEDNKADIRLVKETLELNNLKFKLIVLEDGITGLSYLNREGEYKNIVLPNLILLDLDIPLLNGFDFLKKVKNNDNLKHIPVIVFSESENPNDIKKAYDNYANSFISKPLDFESLVKTFQIIDNFWLKVTELPPVSED